ncbi:MAG: translation elongation factor Ts [Kiritimatiellaeota bacterium]|nr:translation elongation factor Ts [Kiritimatiellota bacterium]
MAEITAAAVNNLRAMTGVGMMDCKKALVETNGDVDAAVKMLRERGVAVAAKRAEKAANQGAVMAQASADGATLAMVEVNCETDFVARNESFQDFVKKVVETAVANPADVAEVMKDDLSAKIAQTGENMKIRRSARYTLSGTGKLSSYIHMGGKVGVMLDVACGKGETVKNAAFVELCNDLCLQIAAAAPKYIAPADVTAEEIAAEREIYMKQMEDQKKPANILEKIVDGKLGKFYAEICLLEQEFVKAGDAKEIIKDVIAKVAKDCGDTIEVKRFVRYQLGA